MKTPVTMVKMMVWECLGFYLMKKLVIWLRKLWTQKVVLDLMLLFLKKLGLK